MCVWPFLSNFVEGKEKRETIKRQFAQLTPRFIPCISGDFFLPSFGIPCAFARRVCSQGTKWLQVRERFEVKMETNLELGFVSFSDAKFEILY